MDELIANDPERAGALMQAAHACTLDAMRDSGRWDDEGVRPAAGCIGGGGAGAALVTFVFKCNLVTFCLRWIPNIATMALRGDLSP